MKFTLRDASICECSARYIKALTDNGFKITEEEHKLPEEAMEFGMETQTETVVYIETLEDLRKLIEVVGEAIVINMDCDDILIYDDYIE